MTFKIGIIGPLNIDLIIRGKAPSNIDELNEWSAPSEVHCLTAGAAGYISQNLKKLGNEIHLVSCIGDDPFGVMIKSSLNQIGINSDHVSIESDTRGAIAIFMLLFGNNKRPLTYRLPTHHGWPPKFSKSAIDYLLDTDLLHIAGYLHFPDLWTDEILNLFKQAKQKGIITSIDPQFPLTPLEPPWINVLKSLIPYIDVLMVDENEAISLTAVNTYEDASESLMNAGFEKHAIKLGSKGVLVREKDKTFEIPSIPPKVFMDSIGAGDSFDAGFLQGILEGKGMIKAAKMGIMGATMSIEGIGGTETFPDRETLKKKTLNKKKN